MNAAPPPGTAPRRALCCLALALLVLALGPTPEVRAGAYDQLKSMSGGGGGVPPVSGPECVSGCGSGGGSSGGSGGYDDDGERRPGGIFGLIDHWADRINAAAEERRAKARTEALAQNKQGVAAYNRGDYAEAYKLFKKANDNNPDDKVMAQNLKNAEDQVARQERENKMREEERREKAEFRKRMAGVAAQMPQPKPVDPAQAGKLARPLVPLPGFAQARWQEYLDARDEADRLYAKLNKDGVLSDEDAKLFYAALQKRNALWDESCSKPLTPQQRALLGLPAHVAVSRTKPTQQAVSQQLADSAAKPVDRRSDDPAKARADGITTAFVADFFSDKITDQVEEKVQDAIEHARGEKWAEGFERLLTVGRIAVTAKEEGAGAAGAEVADLAVSRLPEPLSTRAEFAVEGGRMYSNVAYRALNRFMEDSMRATGREFDAETFWKNFDDSLDEWKKGVKSWVEFGE